MRYFIGRDNSAHSYLVPLDKRTEWLEWTCLPEDDERSWDAPSYATRTDGGLLTFAEPEIAWRKPETAPRLERERDEARAALDAYEALLRARASLHRGSETGRYSFSCSGKIHPADFETIAEAAAHAVTYFELGDGN